MDGLILAGGKSSRMKGKHKGFLVYENETFMERLIIEMNISADRVWISYGKENYGNYDGCAVVTDEYPGCGPMAGIQACLNVCQADAVMVVACDMPFIKSELFTYLYENLGEYDGVVPITKERIHPLAAIYQKSILPVLTEQLGSGDYRLRDALKKLNILYLDVSKQEEYLRMLQNINTVEEYQKLLCIH